MFDKVLVSLASQSVVVVKDWFVSGSQPIVLVRCLRCFAMLLTNNAKENGPCGTLVGSQTCFALTVLRSWL